MKTMNKVCPKHGPYISQSFDFKVGNVLWTQWSACEKCVDEFDADYSMCPGYKDTDEAKSINYLSCGAGRRELEKAGFDKFVRADAKQVQIKILCEQFMKKMLKEDEPVTVFMHGASGTGKTYMALSMMKEWCGARLPKYEEPYQEINEDGYLENKTRVYDIVRYKSGRFIKSDDLCDYMQAKKAYTTGMSKQQAIKYYTTDIPLLIIDEVGRTISSPKVEHDMLFRIIDGRISNGLPTIITANYNQEQIETNLGLALVSRINESGSFIHFDDNMTDMRAYMYKSQFA